MLRWNGRTRRWSTRVRLEAAAIHFWMEQLKGIAGHLVAVSRGVNHLPARHGPSAMQKQCSHVSPAAAVLFFVATSSQCSCWLGRGQALRRVRTPAGPRLLLAPWSNFQQTHTPVWAAPAYYLAPNATAGLRTVANGKHLAGPKNQLLLQAKNADIESELSKSLYRIRARQRHGLASTYDSHSNMQG